MFIINCKNYAEISGARMGRLARAAQKVSERHGVRIALAPPPHMAGAVAADGGVPVLAQHVDDSGVGGTTGFVVPELLKRSGVRGSLVNHSEHRVAPKTIPRLVTRLRDLGMTSVLCVRSVAEARRYSALGPDYIAIEPPELIGSGRAVSRERPELIERAVAAVRDSRPANRRTGLLCGAGLVSGEDVARAVELGSDGILVASGIIKARNWEKTISDFAKPMAAR